MIDLLQAIVRTILEPLLPLPMPLRLLVFILILMPVFSWLTWRAFPWLLTQLSQLIFIGVEVIAKSLLLLEYFFSKKSRIHGSQLPESVYLIGDLLGAIVVFFYKTKQQFKKALDYILKKNKRWMPHARWFVVTAILLPFIWFVRPSIEETQLGKLFSSGFNFWYSLEAWAMTGKWRPYPLSLSPEQFIRNYFSTINQGDYKKAWNLLSDHYKSNKSDYNSYLKWWRDQVKQVNIDQIKLISKNNKSAIVEVHLQFLMRPNGRFTKPEIVHYELVWDSQKDTWVFYGGESVQ
ncbi:MAG: hypothetical protein F6K58_18115 [Symploca sp. SIO2E9]|nr:hypothetical protein [Symploca sp. SIO2E9]